MIKISYAQNYEDVMLARALRGVEHGFYIDIGAQDPINDSVTKAFYEMGWHGINVEPVTHWFQRLEADRPRDTNLQLAVSDSPGMLHLFEVVDSGLSTTTPTFAQQHVLEGHQLRESDVPCVTLDSICETQQVAAVHFLKIDCEGSEAAALRGASLQHIRPWIILLEATEPNSQKPAYEEWEPLLTDRGYHFVYADGLNRFYVADEHAELDRAFDVPPNVFDRFVRAAEATARDRLDSTLVESSEWRMRAEHLHGENERREAALVEHRELLAELRRRLDESLRRESLMLAEVSSLENEIAARDREVVRLQESICEIHRSTSWRITRPLRLVSRGARMAAKGGLHVLCKLARRSAHFARPCLRRLVQWAWLRSLVVRLLGADSGLVGRARLFLFGAIPGKPAYGAHEGQGGQQADAPLTWQAGRVSEEIRQARSRQRRENNPPRAKGG